MLSMNNVSRHNPEAILATWRALAAATPHLHQPQAAAAMRLPEACLAASRCGKAATRLAGERDAILASMTALGKILIAVPHHAGVAIAIAAELSHDIKDGWLTLTAEKVQLRLALSAIDSLYAVIDPQGPHGRERHLQLFDAEGNGICKLLVLYKRYERELVALAERYRSPYQSRVWQPSTPAYRPPAVSYPGDTPAAQGAIECLTRWHKAALPVRFRAQRPNVGLDVVCAPTRVNHDSSSGVLHAHHPTFKLHTRLAAWRSPLVWDSGICSQADNSWFGCKPVAKEQQR
ncbi:hypothetical protein CAI21_13760 [Alkalilimnicola ehrlichii]|uniref:Haemin-degrading HemS/ChuX domain-containing protein n=1 Tax=Alkalilimnicola ehrlichii TaxID=351052 RepID=A0A3E0WRL8_9GAMM|nr:ChuX/HutX family heme-like substrate-binding protein [Alkalilimnicola ehrlichii]RFA27979.1 hypothetical protein CAI21_13760 [Alkalilimnicola ehrlichii]RFA34627.1 hypothetical protein CAL65_14790 [Alkalilimnicola ehrlichii]